MSNCCAPKPGMRNKRKTFDNMGTRMSLDVFDCESRNVDDNFDEEKAYRAISMFICTAEVPPKSFLKQTFKAYLQLVNPRFHIKFDNIERHCLEIYGEEKARIKQLLGSLDGQINLALDVLRHEGRDVYDYMCLTAHFIDGDWNQKNWVINFSRIWYTLDETPEKAILKTLSELDIENKIGTLTLVNHEDYDEAVEIIKARVQEKKALQLKGQIFRVHCCADTFRLMVNVAFEEIESFIWSLRRLIFCWKSFPIWSNTLLKLQEALELESRGEYTEENGYSSLDIPSAEEWKKVKGVCKLVGSIYNAAKALFDTKKPTGCIYLHNIWELRVILMKETTSSDEFVQSVARKMLNKLNRYWEETFLTLAVATVMDPRCKMKYVEYSSMKYEGTAGINSQAATVLDAIQSLYDEYASRNVQIENVASDSTSDDDSDHSGSEDELPKQNEEQRNNPNFGFSCLEEYNQFIQANSQLPKSELGRYLEEPVLPWDQNFKLLRWWKAASPRYPILSKMAGDVLAIPLTLATSCEAYYSDQRKPDTDIIFLSPELMNALMSTRSWFEKHPKKE